jgi:hypothetical protein
MNREMANQKTMGHSPQAPPQHASQDSLSQSPFTGFKSHEDDFPFLLDSKKINKLSVVLR